MILQHPWCQCSTKCLSLVVESLSSVVLLGYPRPSLTGISVQWVLTGTHRCVDAQGGIKAKRQPFRGWFRLEVMWSWTWSEKCVVVNILSDVGTENADTPARLEGLFTSSQSSPFVPSTIFSRSKFPCERLRSQCFVKRSAVLCFVSPSMFVLSLSTVQALCELLLDEIGVPLEVSVST